MPKEIGRVCEHGQLARSCNICQLEADKQMAEGLLDTATGMLEKMKAELATEREKVAALERRVRETLSEVSDEIAGVQADAKHWKLDDVCQATLARVQDCLKALYDSLAPDNAASSGEER